MTDQAIQTYRPVADLMAQDNTIQLARMAKMVKDTAPGGQKYTDREAAQLAVFSFLTDLNIYNRECYMMPGVGPVDGIRGNRRKAKDFIREVDGGGDYYMKFRPALDHEAIFDSEKGDIGWHCTLTDDKSMNEWRKVFNKFFSEFRDAKMDAPEAYDKAMFVAGEKPEWTGVGVVDHREHFSRAEVETWENRKPKTFKKDEEGNVIYEPEKWDKNERAQKRAEKNATGKRYPHSIIPAFGDLMFEHGDKILGAIEMIVDKLEHPEPVDVDKLLTELGYDSTRPGDAEFARASAASQVLVDAKEKKPGGSESELQVEDAEQPAPGPGPVWNLQQNMSLEFASSEVSSDGTEYGDIETDQLSHMYNAIVKSMKKPDLEPEKLEEYQRKSVAIEVIMKHREEEGDA